MPAPNDELRPTEVPIHVRTETTPGGWRAHVTAEEGLSVLSGVASFGPEVVVPMNASRGAGLYDCVYLRFDERGEFSETLREDCGLLPILFAGPEGAPWATLLDPYGARDVSLVLPLAGRVGRPAPKPMKAQPVDPIGRDLFVERSPTGKADRVFAMSYARGVAKRERASKIPLPANHLFVATDEGLQAVVREGGAWTHRAFEGGEITAARRLALPDGQVQPVRLSFTRPSVLTHYDATRLSLAKVAPDGTVEMQLLGTFEPTSERDPIGVYNVFAPVFTGPDGFAFRANGDGWDGWFHVANGELREAWTSRGGAYTDAISGTELELGDGAWRLRMLTATPSGHQMIFVPPGDRKPTELLICGRVWADA